MSGNYDESALFGRESPFRSKLDQVRNQRQTGTFQSPFARQRTTRESLDPLARLERTSGSHLPATDEELERLALYDSLTGLYNHRSFVRELKYELQRGKRYKRPVAVAMLGIDGFAEAKSSWGPQSADEALKAVATLIRGAIREVDIPARYSADEFAVIFPETNATGVGVVAERLRQRIRNQSINLGWQQARLTVSIGVASFPAHAREYDELIARSAQALEFAVQRGGDRVATT